MSSHCLKKYPVIVFQKQLYWNKQLMTLFVVQEVLYTYFS